MKKLKPTATRSALPLMPLLIAGLLSLGALLLTSPACSPEIDKVGLMCSEAEPCDQGLACVNGRCQEGAGIIISPDMPSARTLLPYRGQVTIENGIAPYQLQVLDAGTLLASAEDNDLLLTSAPETGNYAVQVQVTDSAAPAEVAQGEVVIPVLPLPVQEGINLIEVNNLPPAEGTLEFPGNATVLGGNGKVGLSILSIADSDSAPIATVKLAIESSEAGRFNILTLGGISDTVDLPALESRAPYPLPAVVAGSDFYVVGYIAEEGSDQLALVRYDPTTDSQLKSSLVLNGGEVIALDLTLLQGNLYAAVLSVNAGTAQVTVTRFDTANLGAADSTSVAVPSIGSENDFAQVALSIADGRLWLGIATPSGGRLLSFNALLEQQQDIAIAGSFINVDMVGLDEILVSAWGTASASSQVQLYRTTSETTAASNPLLIDSFTMGTWAERLGFFDLFTDAREIGLAFAPQTAPAELALYLGTQDVTQFVEVPLAIESVPGSAYQNPRDNACVARRRDGDYYVFWSEEFKDQTRGVYAVRTTDIWPD